MQSPLVFEEYFELGQQESASPFITPKSRAWSFNLHLKASILAALLLAIVFGFSFFSQLRPLSNVLLIAVYFLAGIPSLIESIEDLLNFDVNIDVLMTLAAFSSVFIGSGMEGGLLLVLFSISGAMEEAVTSKAKSSISHLHKLSPTTAFLVREDRSIVERSIKEIPVHAHIFVKSGQVVPLDGVVIEGISSVNLVHLTGENLPVRKGVGDEVPAGARNLEGSFTLRVTRTSAESTIARIVRLVTQAQDAKPKLQRWFDRLSRSYAITIIALAFSFVFALPFLFGMPFLGREGSVYRALAFLIAASPCALIIALPIAYLSAISVCARRGILLKGGIVLDALASCGCIAFDKTGTLTTGDLSCIGIEAVDAPQKRIDPEVIEVAYGLEQSAIHPIAKAVARFAQEQGIKPAAIPHVKAIPGFGVEAQERHAYIGHPDHILKQLGTEARSDLMARIEAAHSRGEMVAVQSLDGHLYLYRFVDAIRPGMQKTLELLQRSKRMHVVMLTGDHETSARKVATELGIESYYSALKPEEKLSWISKLSQEERLAMVGDGINDAPALARATVGICMGQVGATAAMEASDVVLLHDNIELLDWLIDKARKTQRIVHQNLFLATGAIIFASFPALAGLVPLWLAVILHEGGTVLVGLNALRLLRS